MEVFFAPNFFRQLNKFSPSLQKVAIEKIELFKEPKNHPSLKVHKLCGKLKSQWSFSVTHSHRIVFEFFDKPQKAFLLGIGDHSIYK